MAPRPCIFEYIYFARPDSMFGGRSVYEVRKNMGAQLAKESFAAADVVVPVPTPAFPRRSAIRRPPAFPTSSASSATIMSAGPSSSRPSTSASSACG